MEYFFDCEFVEDGKTIDLISIAIVDNNGRYLYLINKDCDFSKASDWVLNNVLIPLGLDRKGFHKDPGNPSVSPNYRSSFLRAMRKRDIARNIIKFVGGDTPIFWANYAAYDWVALCQCFGTMMRLPKNFPMYCNEFQQLLTDAEVLKLINIEDLPKQLYGHHDALEDARHLRHCYRHIRNAQINNRKC